MPACGLRRGSSGGPGQPIFISARLKTLTRGQASWGGRQGASLGTTSSGWLARRRRVQGGVPREVLVTEPVTIETRQTLGGRRPAQCPCFLFGAKGASAGAEYRGIRQRFPYQCNETKTSRPAGQKGHHGAQDGVITGAFGSRRPPLVRIACTSCPLSKWSLLAPFPLNIWEQDQGLFK